jgi:hypothetical protein
VGEAIALSKHHLFLHCTVKAIARWCRGLQSPTRGDRISYSFNRDRSFQIPSISTLHGEGDHISYSFNRDRSFQTLSISALQSEGDRISYSFNRDRSFQIPSFLHCTVKAIARWSV